MAPDYYPRLNKATGAGYYLLDLLIVEFPKLYFARQVFSCRVPIPHR